MKKTEKIFFALLLIPATVGLIQAGVTSIGKYLSTGEGAADSDTLRVTVGTTAVPVAVQSISSIAISNTISVQNTPATPLYTQEITSITVKGTITPSNTAATPLFTQNISSIAATVSNTPTTPIYTQTAGSQAINGTVFIDQTIPGTSNAVYVTNISTQITRPIASTTVSKSSVSATTTSTQLLAADPTRLGIECVALCSNNKDIFLNINSASAAANTDYPLPPCASWSPPSSLVPTGAIQVIASAGTQGVRCVSYTP